MWPIHRHVSWALVVALVACGDDGTSATGTTDDAATGTTTAGLASTSTTTEMVDGTASSTASSDSGDSGGSGTETEDIPCPAPTPWAQGTTEAWLVSALPTGEPHGYALQPRLSGDGRIVAYASVVSILDTPPGGLNLLVQDNACGQLEQIDVDPLPSLVDLGVSADGSTVIFVEPDQGQRFSRVFAYDRATGELERLDVDPDGVPVDGVTGRASVSADGRTVAFASESDAILPADTDTLLDVFVRDRDTGTTELASVTSDGTKANGASNGPVISADGQRVMFHSYAANLSVSQGSVGPHVYVHDRSTGTTTPVSPQPPGLAANVGTGVFPAASGDARFVVFEIEHSHLPEDADAAFDVYLVDRDTDAIELVSIDGPATLGMHAFGGRVSNDGRFVVFNTGSTWLNPQALFIRDREEGTTISLGRTPSGDAPDGQLYGGEISGDGEWIAFSSNASNLVDPPLPPGNTANVFMTPR